MRAGGTPRPAHSEPRTLGTGKSHTPERCQQLPSHPGTPMQPPAPPCRPHLADVHSRHLGRAHGRVAGGVGQGLAGPHGQLLLLPGGDDLLGHCGDRQTDRLRTPGEAVLQDGPGVPAAPALWEQGRRSRAQGQQTGDRPPGSLQPAPSFWASLRAMGSPRHVGVAAALGRAGTPHCVRWTAPGNLREQAPSRPCSLAEPGGSSQGSAGGAVPGPSPGVPLLHRPPRNLPPFPAELRAVISAATRHGAGDAE